MRASDFVFNTNLPVSPRRTVRPWTGSLRPQDWIPSREGLPPRTSRFRSSVADGVEHYVIPSLCKRFFSLVQIHNHAFCPGHFSPGYEINAPVSYGPL